MFCSKDKRSMSSRIYQVLRHMGNFISFCLTEFWQVMEHDQMILKIFREVAGSLNAMEGWRYIVSLRLKDSFGRLCEVEPGLLVIHYIDMTPMFLHEYLVC